VHGSGSKAANFIAVAGGCGSNLEPWWGADHFFFLFFLSPESDAFVASFVYLILLEIQK
jgi:hypothetical protein